MPGLLDWYLGKTGYEAQQYNGKADPSRPFNLWEPVAGDHGAHGEFDNRASNSSPELWMSIHRNAVAGGLLTLAAV